MNGQTVHVLGGDNRRHGKLALAAAILSGVALESEAHRRRRIMIEEAASRVAATGRIAYDEARRQMTEAVETLAARGMDVAAIETFADEIMPALVVGMDRAGDSLRDRSVAIVDAFAGLGASAAHAADALRGATAHFLALDEAYPEAPCVKPGRILTRGHEVNPYATGRRRSRDRQPVKCSPRRAGRGGRSGVWAPQRRGRA